MTDFSEIKERVRAQLDLADLVRREGVPLKGGPVEFTACCPFHEEKTPSFTVNTEKKFFHCFGCGANGDVFEFLMRKKGLDFMGALQFAAFFTHIAIPDRLYQPREVRAAFAEPRQPFDPDRFRPLTPGGAAEMYLTQQRKLLPDFLTRYSVGETADGTAYAFAYKWFPTGVPRKEGAKPRFEFCKVVKVDRVNGKKEEWREPKGGKNILFGMFAVPEDAAELVICEGEIDAITWAQFGFPAVSVPNGAGYTGWLDICFDWLARFKKIHLSFDEDAAGRKHVVEIVQRLGMARTDIIRLPEKNL